jgi:hypothetical protein
MKGKTNQTSNAGAGQTVESPGDMDALLDQCSVEVLEAVLSILRAQQQGREKSQPPSG